MSVLSNRHGCGRLATNFHWLMGIISCKVCLRWRRAAGYCVYDANDENVETAWRSGFAIWGGGGVGAADVFMSQF